MEEFEQEVKKYSTRDLMLILEDQLDLYSDEEIDVLKAELASRPENALEIEDREQERLDELEEERISREEHKKNEETRKRKLNEKIGKLKDKGYEGYYEYTTISLFDEDHGALSIAQVSELLNEYALEGWRLVTAYTNEVGHNSSNHGIGGFSTGTNSTIDQHILILERFVKI